jgi:hypothetical protein
MSRYTRHNVNRPELCSTISIQIDAAIKEAIREHDTDIVNQTFCDFKIKACVFERILDLVFRIIFKFDVEPCFVTANKTQDWK